MKLLFVYFLALAAAWLGLNAFMLGLAFWEFPGALAPLAAGAVLILISARLMFGVIRMYLRPGRSRYLD